MYAAPRAELGTGFGDSHAGLICTRSYSEASPRLRGWIGMTPPLSSWRRFCALRCWHLLDGCCRASGYLGASFAMAPHELVAPHDFSSVPNSTPKSFAGGAVLYFRGVPFPKLDVYAQRRGHSLCLSRTTHVNPAQPPTTDSCRRCSRQVNFVIFTGPGSSPYPNSIG